MNTLAGMILGRYYLLEQIGLGGMATVFIALDLDRDEKVAIKVLSPHLAQTPQFKVRFHREIELLKDLKHPNIVPILAFGEEEGHAYIVMPYYPTGTLQDRLKKGPLTPTEGAKVMDQLSAALEFAHQRGVVHRDVKPSNVLLDAEGDARLTDFGFAQVEDSTLSLTGSALIGTPAYMSPEQCKGEEVDARSDQYSLGVILHQLTTGRLPFDADTPMGLVMKHVNMPLPPPRLVSPNIPEAVEAVLIKSMAKDPAHRFSSVGEMNRVFQRALSASLDASGRLVRRATPVDLKKTLEIPRTPGMPGAVQRKSRRPSWAWIAAGALFLVLCPLAGWAVVAQGGANGLLGGNGGPRTPTPTTFDLVATNSYLSTQIASLPGLDLNEAQIATAVAGTMTAAAPVPVVAVDTPGPGEPTFTASPTSATSRPIGTGAPSRTPTRTLPSAPTTPGPSPTPTATPTVTRTPTPGPSPTETDTPTVTRTDTPGPTPTPTASTVPSDTPTNTPQPTPTYTPEPPTPTRTPTNTPPPSPTRTPSPIPPNQCKEATGHPHYCTPTPG